MGLKKGFRSNRIFRNWLFFNKSTLVLICLLFTVIVIDTSFARLYDLTSKQIHLETKFFVFGTLSAISLVGQYLVLVQVKLKMKNSYMNKILRPLPIYRIPEIGLVVLSILFIIVGWQLLVESKYSTVLVVMVVTISYGTSSILLGILAYRFFIWIKSNRNMTVVVYGLASISLCANVLITSLYVDTILITSRPSNSYPYTGGSMMIVSHESFMWYMDSAYFITFVFSFVLTWIATVTLLRNYSKIIGKIKYWIIMSFPLIYFLSQFILLDVNMYQLIDLDPVLTTTIFSLVFVFSKSVGGLLYGIAFWTVVRNIPRDSIIRSYMIISAFGFVLLFGSNQAITLVTLPYPPLGLATVSFVGFSSYLIFVGIYYSAISIARDQELRNSVRKLALKDSRLLDSIGYAEMARDIQNIVESVASKMEEDTGVQADLNESDIRNYLDEVVKMREEMGKDK